MARLVIWDFDGALIPGIECSYALFRQQRPGLTLEEYRRWFDINVHDYLAENCITIDLPAFHAAYALAVATLPMESAIKELVAALAKQFSLVIVSSNSGAVIERYLERNGVRSAFSHVWGSEQHTSKIEKIRMLSETYAVLPTDCWFITDTLGDLLECARAGVPSIGVTWGFHPRERLARGSPTLVADTPGELRDFLLASAPGR